MVVSGFFIRKEWLDVVKEFIKTIPTVSYIREPQECGNKYYIVLWFEKKEYADKMDILYRTFYEREYSIAKKPIMEKIFCL